MLLRTLFRLYTYNNDIMIDDGSWLQTKHFSTYSENGDDEEI